MMRRLLAPLLIILMFFTACGEAAEPIPEPTPEPKVDLRPVADSIYWNGITINSITPVTAFESSGVALFVYPYNDSDKHITIEEFYTSGNGFFDTVLGTCEKDNIRKGNGYILFTLPDGVTHAMVPISDDTQLHVYGSFLSSYIEKVAEQLSDTSH